MHQSLGHVIIYIDWVMGKVLESRSRIKGSLSPTTCSEACTTVE